jgi:hypothetical protein
MSERVLKRRIGVPAAEPAVAVELESDEYMRIHALHLAMEFHGDHTYAHLSQINDTASKFFNYMKTGVGFQ